MPNYSYICDKCHNEFELFFYIKDYDEHPKCTTCKSTQTSRLYTRDVSTLSTSIKKNDSELKTIGDLAKRNSDKMSEDQKEHLRIKHNKYKDNKTESAPLPKGMTYTNKPKTKIKWTN